MPFEALQLTDAQAFDQECQSRAIDATDDVEALRGIAKKLLLAWHTQKAATNWAIRMNMGQPAPLPLQRPEDRLAA